MLHTVDVGVKERGCNTHEGPCKWGTGRWDKQRYFFPRGETGETGGVRQMDRQDNPWGGPVSSVITGCLHAGLVSVLALGTAWVGCARIEVGVGFLTIFLGIGIQRWLRISLSPLPNLFSIDLGPKD